MTLDDSYDHLTALLERTGAGDGSGAELLRLWREHLSEACAAEGEDLEAIQPADLYEKMVKELERAAKTLGLYLHNRVKRRTRAIWIGLFEEGLSRGTTVTTYASFSEATSQDDKHWPETTRPLTDTYRRLPQLNKVYRKPDGVSSDTANRLYILTPLAFLAALTLDVTDKPKLKNIQEYAFGWDSGDFLNWTPPAHRVG